MSADKPLSRRVAVVVKRDLVTGTTQTVWQHEIPLLEEIHGAETVTDVTADTIKLMDAGHAPSPMDAHGKPADPARIKPSEALGLGDVFDGGDREAVEAEYLRLQTVYGEHPKQEMSVVQAVFGRLNEGRFQALLGAPQLTDLSNRQLRKRLAECEMEVDAETTRADMIKAIAGRSKKEKAA